MDVNHQSNPLASTLFWFWGVFLLLSGFAVGYPALMVHGTAGPLLLFCSWGLACCVAGFAARRGRWGVRKWGAALCIVGALFLFAGPFRGSVLGLVGTVLNLAILGVLLLARRKISSVPP